MLLDMAKVCCTDCCLYQLLDITQTYKVIYKSKSLFFKYMTSKAKGQGVNLSVKADLAQLVPKFSGCVHLASYGSCTAVMKRVNNTRPPVMRVSLMVPLRYPLDWF